MGRGQASNLGAWELLLEKQILSVPSKPGLHASEQRKDLQCPTVLWPGLHGIYSAVESEHLGRRLGAHPDCQLVSLGQSLLGLGSLKELLVGG